MTLSTTFRQVFGITLTKYVLLTLWILYTLHQQVLCKKCTLSNISFGKYDQKAVKSTAEIAVWTFGLNDEDRFGQRVLWRKFDPENKSEKAIPLSSAVYDVYDTTNLTCNFGLCLDGESSFNLTGKNMSSTINLKLKEEDDGKVLELHDGRCGETATGIKVTMLVRYCNASTEQITFDQNSSVEINSKSGTKAAYNETGICKCENGSHLFFPNETQYDGLVWCNDSAKWEGCEGVQCWSAPSISSIEQKPSFAGEYVHINCEYTDGFPNKTDITYFIGDKEVHNGETKLNSSHHLEEYFCNVTNQYTSVKGYGEKSAIRNMIVYFGPEPVPGSGVEELQILVNKTELATFTFRANDVNGSVTAKLKGPGIVTPVSNTTDNKTATYIFSYDITVNSENDRGKYVFTAYTVNPNSSANISLQVVSYEVTTSMPTAMPTASSQQNGKGDGSNIIPIAAGCGAAGLVIIALVVGLIFYRKRKGKDDPDPDIREERDNPLYGSTPGPPPYDEYASVDKKNKKKKKEKEEKVNPLYEGTSTNENMVEDAYAAVDKKAKKGKKDDNTGKENSAFADEATYAAVIKPKKKKNVEPQPDVVYSAVQRKRKDDRPDLQN